MNSDFIQSVIVKVVMTAGTVWATKHGITVDGSSLQMLAGGLATVAAGAWGIYQHYGMKKVPETAIVVAR